MLRAATRATFLLIVATITPPAGASAAWNQPVGGPNPINQATNTDAVGTSLAAIGGVPYVAWSEYDLIEGNTEIRVARLNAAGTDWEEPWTGVSGSRAGSTTTLTKTPPSPA